MLTRLQNGRYIDLDKILSIEIQSVKKYGKDLGEGYQAVGIALNMREIRITDFFHDKDQCQRELDQIILGKEVKSNE